jgi:hypothetical protein
MVDWRAVLRDLLLGEVWSLNDEEEEVGRAFSCRLGNVGLVDSRNDDDDDGDVAWNP